jgi:hypothetical protein
LMTSQRMRCPPTHLPTRLPTTRTLDMTATESGTNDINVSESLFLSGISTRLWIKLPAGYTPLLSSAYVHHHDSMTGPGDSRRRSHRQAR